MIIKKLQKLIVVFLLLCQAENLTAQSAVNSAGGNATSVSGSVSYSVGQISYTAVENSSGNIEQGVQHAYEVFQTGIYGAFPELNLSIFPNPTSQSLHLKFQNDPNNTFEYMISDINGKQILRGDVFDINTTIDLSPLLEATYFLHILSKKNNSIKTFEILKTN